MNNKLYLGMLVLFFLASNVSASNQVHRLIIGTGPNMQEVQKNSGTFSPKLIVITPNDITIDTEPKVNPSVVGSMGDATIYDSKSELSKLMKEKNFKEFDAIIFEHTPSVEEDYITQTINKKISTAFQPRIFEKREKSAGVDLKKYFKAFNGTYYTIILNNILKDNGTLTILSQRFNYEDPNQVWAEWCGKITSIADLNDQKDKMSLNGQVLNRCKIDPEGMVKDYYNWALEDNYTNIHVDLIDDKEYVETQNTVRQGFKYIKVTATKKWKNNK